MINTKKFWEFMIERENIRLRREAGVPMAQWTQDEIFKTYSFTNVKRHHDRTTALLDKEFYFHRGPFSSDRPRGHACPETLLNAAIFRYHGTIESARAIGWHDTWNDAAKAALIRKNELRMADRDTVFTSAYIVPNCGDTRPKHEIVADIVDSIWKKADFILNTDSWESACDRLCTLWGIGSFMAKEVLLDYILATKWVPKDWDTWTPVGPGGRKGAGYVKYDRVKRIDDAEALEVIRELYAGREEFWPSDFVKLDLTDIQFQLCEIAKYVKTQRGDGRPKRRFRPTIDDITKKIATR